MSFGQGPIWPDAAGTPTDPSVAYILSTRELEVVGSTELLCRGAVTGEGCTAIELLVEVATDPGETWRVVERRTIPGACIGNHQVSISLPYTCLCRLSARRLGGSVSTLLVVHAEARPWLGELTSDGQPLELAEHQEAGVVCWSDGAAPPVAQALQLAYGLGPAVGGTWFDAAGANELVVYATLLGPTTSVEMQLEESLDNGVTSAMLDASEVSVDGANGTYRASWPCLSRGRYRLWAKRTGAAATMLALVRSFRTGRSSRQEIVLASGLVSLPVDVTLITGNAVVGTGVAGMMPAAGDVADGGPVSGSNPLKIGAVADEVPSAVADGEVVHLITDLERFLRVVDKAHDVLVAAELVACVNPDSSNRDAAAQIVCDEANLAASAAFPSAAGIEIGDQSGLAFILSLEDVTSVLFGVSNDGVVWDDATAQLMADGALGRAPAYFTSGAGVTTIFSCTWDCGHNFIRCYVTVPNATNTIYIDLIQRAR